MYIEMGGPGFGIPSRPWCPSCIKDVGLKIGATAAGALGILVSKDPWTQGIEVLWFPGMRIPFCCPLVPMNRV